MGSNEGGHPRRLDRANDRVRIERPQPVPQLDLEGRALSGARLPLPPPRARDDARERLAVLVVDEVAQVVRDRDEEIADLAAREEPQPPAEPAPHPKPVRRARGPQTSDDLGPETNDRPRVEAGHRAGRRFHTGDSKARATASHARCTDLFDPARRSL
jgi:hypothetical protein